MWHVCARAVWSGGGWLGAWVVWLEVRAGRPRASGAETGDHAGDGAERAGRSTVSTPHDPRHAGARTTLDRSPQWLRGTERVCTFCGDYRFVTGTAPIPQIDVSAPR